MSGWGWALAGPRGCQRPASRARSLHAGLMGGLGRRGGGSWWPPYPGTRPSPDVRSASASGKTGSRPRPPPPAAPRAGVDCSNRPAPCLSFPRCSHCCGDLAHDAWETDAHRGSGIGSARGNALVGFCLPSLSAGGPNPSHRAVGAAGPGRAPAGPGLYASPSSAFVTVSAGRT